MKKKIVQDVIPPKKTIRSIDLPSKSRLAEKIPTTNIKNKPEASKPKIEVTETFTDLSYKYEYDEPVKKRSKKVLYISTSILIIALLFGISALFKSAEIRVTPKNEIGKLDDTFKAIKNGSDNNGLGYQIVTTSKDIEKTIPATDEQQVDAKATGIIVVYNNNPQTQSLIKTTRFQTSEGLIFRSTESVTIPKSQVKNGKNVAGSAEVHVEADKAGSNYNIGLKDFTIVGFKGTPKYTTVYGRSKTIMSGGFSGMQGTVSTATITSIDKQLEGQLRDSLSKDIISQIPENFVIYPESISYKFGQSVQTNGVPGADGVNTVILKKKGSISAIIFDKASLTRAIIVKILPEAINDSVKITNLDKLNFSFATNTTFDPNTTTLLNFNLTGAPNFVWVYDESKLKSDILGLSKRNAITIIATYNTIKDADIETRPFWNDMIPKDPNKVSLINNLAN